MSRTVQASTEMYKKMPEHPSMHERSHARTYTPVVRAHHRRFTGLVRE
jgi:hypothetical protein